MNILRRTFKTAPFPAVMTILSLAGFIGVYLLVTAMVVEPLYLGGLLFAVPAVCFGLLTFFTAKGKLKFGASVVLTIVSMVVMGIGMLFACGVLWVNAATTVTTDTGKYERALKLNGYPHNTLIDHFPSKIPDGAKNVVFQYNPAFLQGGEIFALKFETNADSVRTYRKELSQKAAWTGKADDAGAETNGIFSGTFSACGYDELPDDFTIYLIYGKPYQGNNWNHGKISLAAVSGQRREVLFYAEDW